MSPLFLCMSKNNFRRDAKNQVEAILTHWRHVERWIKKAEGISKKVPTAAINELRYAGRQLFYAIILLRKQPLNDGVRSSITKRLIIAEQYLINADHDVCDAVLAFFSEYTTELTQEFGVTQLTELYIGYPSLCKTLQDVGVLSEEARNSAERRVEVYEDIRENHLQSIIDTFDDLQSAELGAKSQRARLEAEFESLELEYLHILERNKGLKKFGMLSGLASIVAIPLSLYFYLFPFSTDSTIVPPIVKPSIAAPVVPNNPPKNTTLEIEEISPPSDEGGN